MSAPLIPAAPPAPPGPTAPPPASSEAPTAPRPVVPRTRTGVIWVTVCVGALLAVALIAFMLQNTHTVEVTFLGMTGSTSLSLMLLIAAVGGILLTLMLGSARIVQLRHQARKRR
jgi:uncharacterized integral membrane protein